MWTSLFPTATAGPNAFGMFGQNPRDQFVSLSSDSRSRRQSTVIRVLELILCHKNMYADLRQSMAGPSTLPSSPSPSRLSTPSTRRSSVATTDSYDSDSADSMDGATIVGSVDEDAKEDDKKPQKQSQGSSFLSDFDLADCWRRLFGGISL